MEKWFLNLNVKKREAILCCLFIIFIVSFIMLVLFVINESLLLSSIFYLLSIISLTSFVILISSHMKKNKEKARILQDAAKRLKDKQSIKIEKPQNQNYNSHQTESDSEIVKGEPAQNKGIENHSQIIIKDKKPTIEELRLAKSLSRINKIIDDFFILGGDKTLNKVLEEFYKNNANLSFEYYSAPMKKNDYSDIKPNYKLSDLSHIDPERLKKVIFSMTIVYNSYVNDKYRFKNEYFGRYDNHFFSRDYGMRYASAKEKIEQLYYDLITNGILTTKTEEQSFFTYMNEFYHRQRHRDFNRLSIEYGIKKNSSFDDAIQALIEKDVGEKGKEFYIALKKLKEDNSKCF